MLMWQPKGAQILAEESDFLLYDFITGWKFQDLNLPSHPHLNLNIWEVIYAAAQ